MVRQLEGANDVRRSPQADLLALFSVLWALAAVWHLLGATTTSPAWAQALLVVGIAAVLLWPGSPAALGALALGGIITMWEEAPVLGNHWLLAGAINLVILLALGVGALRRRFSDGTDLANRLFPAARLCLLGFYCFAAFAKLNSAFFDRSVSCAAFYFRESTDSLGLRVLQLGGAAWLENLVIVATVVVELSIPVLLLVARTRRIGVVIALVFHAVLALDRSHQFFDFSAVLFALFPLFLAPSAGTWVAERVGSVRARLALRNERLPERAHLAAAAVPIVVALLVTVDVIDSDAGVDVGWLPWQLFSLTIVIGTIWFVRQQQAVPAVRLMPHHAVFLLVPLLVVLNGLTPYLELKTGYGWNMYANLRTVDGESNHLLVRRTLPLTDEQDDIVRIIDTNASGLVRYQETDYGLTWRQLRTYMANVPNRSITYERAGERIELDRASDLPELVEPVPSWREKVQLFRAVDLTSPERCVPAFGPAR